MHHRLLPDDLQECVRRYDQYKWLQTRGVDEERQVQTQPEDLRRNIKRYLCLALVKRAIHYFFVRLNSTFSLSSFLFDFIIKYNFLTLIIKVPFFFKIFDQCSYKL